MKLLIVETLKEVGKIRPVLESLEPNQWTVRASMTLVCKLSPIRIENPGEKVFRHFGVSGEYHDEALYENTEGQKTTLAGIHKRVSSKDIDVYLATGPGLKGESLAWHLQRILGIKNPKRAILHEYSSAAIKAALAKSRAVNVHLVKAYEEHFSAREFLAHERAYVDSLSSFASLIKSQAKNPQELFDNAEIERRHKTHAAVIGPFIEQWIEDCVYDLADTANQILENAALSALEKQAMLKDLEELAFDPSLWRKLVHGEPRKPVLSLSSRFKKPKAETLSL